jgi:hypothetical protein
MVTSATFGLNSSQILDINGTLPTPNTNGAALGYMKADQSAFNIWDVVKGIYSSSAFGISSNTGTSYTWTPGLVTAPSTSIWTIYTPSTSATYYSYNYGSATSVTSNIPTSAIPVGALTGPTTNTLTMQWIRIRMYPPGGVMPSTSAGSITTISGNKAPSVLSTSPSNLQTGVPITLAQLSFNLQSSVGAMNYSVSTNPSIGSGQGLNVPNGTYYVSVTGLGYSTTYSWNINVTDGTLWTNVTLTFTTESSPFITSYSPGSQITLDRGNSQTFQISFSDPMDTTWYLNGVTQQYNTGVSSSSWNWAFGNLGIFNVTCAGTLSGFVLAQQWSVQVIINFSSGVVDRQMTNFGPSQAWEEGWVFDESVWKANGTYFMLYAGRPIGQRMIGFAWSNDGLTWTKYAGNPILSPTDPGAGTWENKEDFWPSSIINVNGTYWVYYQGIDTSGGTHSGLFFFNFEPDGAGGYVVTNVTRYSGNPIISDTYELTVAQVNATYWIGYNGYSSVNFLDSPDGMHWTYEQRNVIMPSGSGWDSSLHYSGHIFFMDGTMYLTVQGNNQQGGVDYCKVGDWTDLTHSPYNPILPSETGVQSYVLGPCPIYDAGNDTLDIWYIAAESLGGTGPTGCGFGVIYNVTGENTPPSISNPSPANGAINVPVSLSSLSINLIDYQGNLMNYSITTSPNIGTGSGVNVPNGYYSLSVAGLNYSTTYNWIVTANAGAYTTNMTFSFTTAAGPFDPFSSGWQYRKEITINHAQVAGDQTNFPVLIDITDHDLASKACSDGYDILFMNGTGVAWKLNDEIESYNSNTGCLVAWVNIPSLSSTSDTLIYMYYGNPSSSNQQTKMDVWDSNFVMVLHFDETSGTQYDSTSYQNNGTPYNVTEGVSGMIDGADSFGTGTPYVEVPNAPSLSPTVLTVEAWIQPNTVSGEHPIIEKYDWLAGTGGYLIRQSDDSLLFDVLQGTTDNLVWANHVLQVGNWYFVVGTFDGSYLKIYVNGQLVNQAAWTGSNLASSSSLKIGTRGNDGASSGLFFSGIIDEARVSNIARSTGWISTEYNNENNPSTFSSVGAEEEAPTPTLQMTPGSITCRKYDEYFIAQVNVTNANTVNGFNFTIYFSPTLINYVSVAWGDLGTGTITSVDPLNGVVQGYVAGAAISGNHWLMNITFQDIATLIWKRGQVNELDGQIWFHDATLGLSGSRQLVYQEGGTNQISVNNVVYAFIPIQGDVNNDGVVNISDLRTVAAYFDVKQGDTLWSAASAYDLNGNGVIDIYDLVLIGANFGYTYP